MRQGDRRDRVLVGVGGEQRLAVGRDGQLHGLGADARLAFDRDEPGDGLGAGVDHGDRVAIRDRDIQMIASGIGDHPLGVAGEIAERAAQAGDRRRNAVRRGIDHRQCAVVLV